MLVSVTGGSGFIGSRVVAALLDHGHRPRLLVRDRARAERILAAVGVDADAVEYVAGDMADEDAVGRLLDGAEAAVHTAAVVDTTGVASDALAVNLTGTRLVVGGAVARGLDPIVYLSSVAVFVPPHGPRITAESPLASPRTEYGRSKVDAEHYVRGLQDAGGPVVTLYPAGVVGPSPLPPDALLEGLAEARRVAFPITDGGVGIVDVRDLAEAIARCIAPGGGPRRFVFGGTFLTWPELAELCDELTGVRARRLRLPGRLLLATGSLLDAVRRARPVGYPLTRDAAETMVTMVPTDDTPLLEEVGLRPRPVAETLADTFTDLARRGHLPAEAAGRLAPPDAVVVPRRRIRRALVQPVASSAAFARYAPKVVPRLDRALHRLTKGRVVMSRAMLPSIVLTTTGHRSGEPREVPLAAMPRADGSWIVVGSSFGRDAHPAWTTNLLKEPAATVSHGSGTVEVHARQLEGAERDRVWPVLLDFWPPYAAYERRSGRRLRVFELRPSS